MSLLFEETAVPEVNHQSVTYNFYDAHVKLYKVHLTTRRNLTQNCHGDSI